MTHFTRVLSIAALLFFPAVRPRAQPIDNSDITPANKADAFLKAELSAKRIPGMAICVVRSGKVELARGYGSANVEMQAPASDHTVFELASLTKPFTAAAVMMLVEEGKISLDDRLPKYFPAAPTSWTNVSVEHLLRHTSGFGDFFAIPGIAVQVRLRVGKRIPAGGFVTDPFPGFD